METPHNRGEHSGKGIHYGLGNGEGGGMGFNEPARREKFGDSHMHVTFLSTGFVLWTNRDVI